MLVIIARYAVKLASHLQGKSKKKMKAIWCSCLLVLASRHAVVSVLASLPPQTGVKVAVETVTAVFDVLSSKCCSGSDIY